MAFGRVRARLWAAAGLACVLSTGCSTVVIREPQAAVASAAGQSDLILAAEAVSETRWPRSEGGLSSMFGGGDSSDSAASYVAQLGEGPGRGVAVLKDAYVHIDAAHRLAAAADRATAITQPSDEDVRVVESAIGDLRDARDVYLASLRALGAEGDGVEPRTEQSLKAAFNEAIREIGAAADALSDRVAARKLEANAERRVAPVTVARFTGL